MNQELLNVIISAIGIILTGLASFATTVLVKWLNSKIKDKDLARWSAELAQIIMTSVQQIMQTYVDSLKKEGAFTKEAQEQALNQCMEIVTSQLSVELKEYIQSNFGEMNAYLRTQIEAMIYNLKK